MNEIKPCPFCGVVPELKKDEDGRYDIQCENPECKLQVFLDRFYSVKREAIEAWNRRV